MRLRVARKVMYGGGNWKEVVGDRARWMRPTPWRELTLDRALARLRKVRRLRRPERARCRWCRQQVWVNRPLPGVPIACTINRSRESRT